MVLALVLPMLALWYGVLVDITLPGLYMDAVNPDYLAIPILHSNMQAPVWVLPGNWLFGRVSVLSSLYYGNFHTFVGVPLYALFGTSIVSIRIVHGLFASMVLLISLLLMRRAGAGNVLLAAFGTALALDPSFLFAFRTQCYITMTPAFFLLAGLLALDSASRREAPGRMLALAGGCYGMAVYGYFVYGFYFPAMAIALATWPMRATTPVKVRLKYWLAGLMIGLAGYWLGYGLLMVSTGGPRGLLDFILNMQRDLGAFNSSLGFVERIEKAWQFVNSITQIWWYSTNWDGQYKAMPFGATKTFVLVIAPLLVAAAMEFRRVSTRFIRVVCGLGVSFFIVSLIFGGRLGGHHYVSLIVLCYVAWAAIAVRLYALMPPGIVMQSVRFVCFGGLAVLVVHSVAIQIEAKAKLRENGGVALFSDSVTRFGEEILTQHIDAHHVLPDWGLLMPTIFLTGGRAIIENDAAIGPPRAALCQGHEVRVAIISGDRTQRIADWTRDLRAGEPQVEIFRQRNGPIVFEVADYRLQAADRERACADLK